MFVPILIIFLVIPACFVAMALIGSLFGRMPSWLKDEAGLWATGGRMSASEEFYLKNKKAGGKGMPKFTHKAHE